MKRKAAEVKASTDARCIPTAVRPRLMCLKDASLFLGISVWCLRELAWKGKIPVVQFGERKWFFRTADLDRLVEEPVRVIE